MIVTYKDGTVFDVAKELGGSSSEGDMTTKASSSSNGGSRPFESNDDLEKTSSLLPALRTAVAKLTPQSPEPSDEDDDDDLLRQDLNLSSSAASSSNGSLNAKDLAALRNGAPFDDSTRKNGSVNDGEDPMIQEEEESYEVIDDHLSRGGDPSKDFLISIVPNPSNSLTESQHFRLSYLLFAHRLETSPTPTATELTNVCKATSLEEDFVRNWFQDRVGKGIHRLLEERWQVSRIDVVGGETHSSSEVNGKEGSSSINSNGGDTVTSRSRRVIKPAKRFIEEHETMVKKMPASSATTTSTTSTPQRKPRESTPSGLEPNSVSEAAVTPSATAKNKSNNNNTIGYGNRKFVAMTLAQIQNRVDKLPNALQGKVVKEDIVRGVWHLSIFQSLIFCESLEIERKCVPFNTADTFFSAFQ